MGETSLVTPACLRFIVAADTAATSSPYIDVGICQWMTLRAMGLLGVDRSDPDSSQEVGPLRHCLQMIRSDTYTDPAQVVNLKALRNLTHVQLVRENVSVPKFPVDTDTSVSMTVRSPLPYPMVTFLDFSPESILSGYHQEMVTLQTTR
jgi:hypothetical protein